ncbi:MAG: DUF3368 domain-containing protein [Nitrososphaera sp.]|nr:DUF3368 domain-containing protein [Nitrososphaera sp.]
MKVVSNTSPICYLRLIDEIQVLPALFGEIIIPEAVSSELKSEKAPDLLREWIMQPPAWLKIQPVSAITDSSLNRLHAGEREAIILAQNLSADLVLLDEKAARQIALQRGLRVIGLLGILAEASAKGLVDLLTAVEHLRHTNFRASPSLLKKLLDRHFS